MSGAGRRERAAYREQDQAQEFSEPGEDAAEVVADGREDDIGGVSVAAFEIAASEVTFGLQVADDGFDSGATA